MVRKTVFAVGLALFASYPALSQEWTFGEVEKLPSAINSAAEETMPLLAPDGKTLYFTRLLHKDNVGGAYGGMDIWQSRFEGGRWSKAERVSDGLNTRGHNAIVGISSDGKTIYLVDASSHRKMKGIHFTKNIGGKWTSPELIPIEGISSEGFVGFYVSPDFEVILISMKGEDSKGEEDLYVCLKDQSGKWSAPKNLGVAINTAGFETSPFLSADKNRLYFSSNGHPGLGDGDIFYCDRLYDSWGTWSIPRNLGEKINSKGFDGYFNVQDTLILLASDRDNQGTDVHTAVIQTPEDRSQEVKKILEEAKNLLGDISSRNDSLGLYTERMLIRFSANSAVIDAQAKRQLDVLVNLLRIDSSGQMEMTGYSEDEALTSQRIQSILEYLERASITGLQTMLDSKAGNGRDRNVVELRY